MTITPQTTIQQIIEIAKADYIEAQNKAKRMKELEEQMKQLHTEYSALADLSLLPKSCGSEWEQELKDLVANAIREQSAEDND